MFERTVNGAALRFHLAGINNQNFLMRDEQTGTYWQQITGLAISGPLAGQRLTLVPADELTFATWKKEQPQGTVLNDVPAYRSEYAPKDWDVDMEKRPTVIAFQQPGLHQRDIMLGVHNAEASRAFPYNSLLKDKLIQDRVGSQQIILILGADNRSVRAFKRQIPGVTETPQFYRVPDLKAGGLFIDAQTGTEWDFKGCGVAGTLKGACLEPVNVIKDYWFDWRNYNPATTVFGLGRAAQPAKASQ